MERFDEGKSIFTEASENENIFGIAPGKIPEYFIAYWRSGSLIE
ncbi:hypothetical protein [Hydrocoleum sp. CS-953]|nr:hypothetical protein [Hydrocoleum sp. CS-953]